LLIRTTNHFCFQYVTRAIITCLQASTYWILTCLIGKTTRPWRRAMGFVRPAYSTPNTNLYILQSSRKLKFNTCPSGMYFYKLLLPEQKFNCPKKLEGIIFLWELHKISVLRVDTLMKHIWSTMTYVFSTKVYLKILLAKCMWLSLREMMTVWTWWIDLKIEMSDHWKQKQLRILICPVSFYYWNFYIPVPTFTWPRASGFVEDLSYPPLYSLKSSPQS
jgi:hypothetical protein